MTPETAPRRTLGRPAPAVAATRPQADPGQLQILLVEDDAADASLILSALNKHPAVRAARVVAAPVQALRELVLGWPKPDLVLLDLQMPRIGGFEWLKGLRRIPGFISVPVVFLTTSDLGQDMLEYMRSSAALYVVKPDTFAELQTRIDGIITRTLSGVWSD